MSMQESKRYTALLNKFSQNRILYISEGQLLVVKPKSDRFKFLKKKNKHSMGEQLAWHVWGTMVTLAKVQNRRFIWQTF